MEDQSQHHYHVSPGKEEIVIRHGEAPEAIPFRKSVHVSGNIDVPKEHLRSPGKRLTEQYVHDSEQDNQLAVSYLKVSRDDRSITFVEDAGMPWENKYHGQLKLDPRFERFQINTGHSRTTHELADLFKMNRTLFETKDKAMVLVSELRQFKAKVEKDIEENDDKRGNTKILYSQAVQSNIPKSFKLNIPVFKGQEPWLFEVEIEIDPSDLSCRLISPEANDFIEENTNNLIDSEIAVIQDQYPALRIFEV